jgi:hypothetical protein
MEVLMTRQANSPKTAPAAQRNRYFRGKLLTVADYAAEQRYHIERRWLINRAIHGWGVIAGLTVEAEDGVLKIAPGLAFDRHGRELVACAQAILEGEDDMVWLGGDARGLEPAAERAAGSDAAYLLSAHYAERGVDGVRIDDGCGDSICEANRISETLVFSLTRHPPGDGRDASAEAADDFDPCRTARLARIGGLDVALDAPVPLARITVRFDRAGAPAFAAVDPAYRPRRRAQAPSAPDPVDPATPEVCTGLEVVHVAVPTPAVEPAPVRPPEPASDPAGGPDEALANERLNELIRKAGEAEAASRAQEQASAETRAKADSARREAADADEKLRQSTQALGLADADLAALKAEAAAAADKLQQATAARLESEQALAVLKEQAKTAAEAQRRLAQARSAREQGEANQRGLHEAREAAGMEFVGATNSLNMSRANPFDPNHLENEKKAFEAVQKAQPKFERAMAVHEHGERNLAELRALELAAAADAQQKAAVSPETIDAADSRVKAAARDERELKAATEKTIPKKISAAEQRSTSAKSEAEEAQRKAESAKEEARLRAEAQATAERESEAAKAAWQEQLRQLEQERIASTARLAAENARLAGLVRRMEDETRRLAGSGPDPAGRRPDSEGEGR